MRARGGNAQTLSVGGGKETVGDVGSTSEPASVMLAQIEQKSSLSWRPGPTGVSADPDLMLVRTVPLASAEANRHLSGCVWPS